MKNLWVAFIVFVLAVTLVSCALAAATPSRASNLEEKRFIGTVVTADDIARTLTVKAWWREVVFDVASAHFAEDSGLQELKPGDRVLIRYIEDKGKRIAGSIIKADRRHKTGEKIQSGASAAKPDHAAEN
jgi:hypothetical protein